VTGGEQAKGDSAQHAQTSRRHPTYGLEQQGRTVSFGVSWTSAISIKCDSGCLKHASTLEIRQASAKNSYSSSLTALSEA
jgi:hypothetical protein